MAGVSVGLREILAAARSRVVLVREHVGSLAGTGPLVTVSVALRLVVLPARIGDDELAKVLPLSPAVVAGVV